MAQRDKAPLTTEERVRRNTRWFVVVAAVIVVLVIGGVLALAQWAQNRPSKRTTNSGPEFSDYEAAWTSAMAKAGVEATFPAGPVDLTSLSTSGRQEFSAQFTGEEIGALAAVYRYSSEAFGSDVNFGGLEVAFPEPGKAALSGKLYAEGSAYSVSAVVPATYQDGGIVFKPQGAELTVEGFGVGGDRKIQALDALGDYLNALLDAAPGLEIERAEIVDGGVLVEGTAPVRLENPPPAESSP